MLQSGQPSLAREDFGLVPQASKKNDRGSRLERFSFSKKGSRPAPKHLRRECGCPNVYKRLERGWTILSLTFPQYLAAPPTREKEEEEEEMVDLVHNFGARKRK